MRKKWMVLASALVGLAVCLCLLLALIGGSYWALRSSYAGVRDPLMELLVRVGEPSVVLLAQVMEDPAAFPAARAAAAHALGQIGGEEATDCLVASLSDPNPVLGPAVIEGLAMIGQPAVAPVIAALDDPAARANAVKALLSIAANSDERLILSGADLRNAVLRSAQFAGADLSGADLSGASLAFADLSAANLSGANLSQADLQSANLALANLSEADLSGATLVQASLADAELAGAVLTDAFLTGTGISAEQLTSAASVVGITAEGCDLQGAALSGIDLSGANLSEAYAPDADLSSANLTGVMLARATLVAANLSGSVLEDANLNTADLSGANLSGANLLRANLRNAVLREANLQQANLALAALDHADLTAASMRQAVLVDASFSEAVLNNADLSGCMMTAGQLAAAAYLRGAVLGSQQLAGVSLENLDLSQVDLSGAILRDADLSYTRLMGANLSGANLSGAWLDLADLSGANLAGANLTQATLDLANLTGADLSGANLRQARLVGAAGVTDEMLASVADLEGARLDSMDRILTVMRSVCVGQGVEAAASYTPGPGKHPLVILYDESGLVHYWNNNVPAAWQPMGIRFTELVVCVSEGEQIVEVCGPYYSGGQRAPDITRYRYTATIRLVAAKTGRTVATRTFYGSYPRQCSSSEPYWLTRLEGSTITFSDVEDWLESFVMP